jgi:hypothetical protein
LHSALLTGNEDVKTQNHKKGFKKLKISCLGGSTFSMSAAFRPRTLLATSS